MALESDVGMIKIYFDFIPDKMTESWWEKLFISEPALDTTKLNCNRPIEDLSQDTQAMIRKMQWDNQQKLLGQYMVVDFFFLFGHRFSC